MSVGRMCCTRIISSSRARESLVIFVPVRVREEFIYESPPRVAMVGVRGMSLQANHASERPRHAQSRAMEYN